MIRHQHLTTILRFFDDEHVPTGARFDALAIVSWEQPTLVYIAIYTAHGSVVVSRKALRDLVNWCADQGIELLRTRRGIGHDVPMGELQNDGTFLSSIVDLAAYCMREERRRYSPGVRPPAPPPPDMPQRRRGERDWLPTVPMPLGGGRRLEDHHQASDPPAEPVRRVPPEPIEQPGENHSDPDKGDARQ